MAKVKRVKKFEFSEDILKKIERLAGLKFSKHEICDYFGISQTTWYSAQLKNVEIDLSFKRGKSSKMAQVCEMILEKALEGNMAACALYVKGLSSWRDETKISGDVHVEVSHNKDVITKLGNDPMEASRIYQRIMMEK